MIPTVHVGGGGGGRGAGAVVQLERERVPGAVRGAQLRRLAQRADAPAGHYRYTTAEGFHLVHAGKL